MAEASNAHQVSEPSQHGHGRGLYAVHFSSSDDSILIPLSYKIPTITNESGEAIVRRNRPQRQVNGRRFQVPNQLNVVLIIKLAFAVFLFSQDGSTLRLIGLLLLAIFIYLYQTGVFAPLIRHARQRLVHQPLADRPQNAANAQNNVNNHPPANAIIENENRPENAGMNQPEIENLNQNREQDNNRINWRVAANEIRIFVVGFIASLLPGFQQHNE